MKKNVLKILLCAISLLISSVSAKAGQLIYLSSATYGTGATGEDIRAVAVDSSDNIIVAGYQSNDYHIKKYNSDFSQLIASKVYDGGNGSDYAYGITVDSSDNIIVTGYRDNGPDYEWFTIKYNSSFVVLSSAPYNSGNGNDYANAVTVDSADNIIVTGQRDNGPDAEYFTIKYNSDFSQVLSSATYNVVNGTEVVRGVMVDSSDNIIVSGERYNGTDYDYFTIKYDSSLVVLSSAVYDGGNDDDYAQSVAVDSADNIIVAGYRCSGGTSYDYFTIKYDSNLVALSSAVYDGGTDNDYARSVAVDSQNNVIVSGRSDLSGKSQFFTVKYNADLDQVISSGSYVNTSDSAYAVTVDGNDNIIVGGAMFDGNAANDFLVIKYLGSPNIASVSPVSGSPGNTFDCTISGSNFYSGASVSCSGTGISCNSVTVDSDTQITVNVTISAAAVLGKRNFTVTNIDGSYSTKTDSFEIVNSTSKESNIDSDASNTVTLSAQTGDMVVEIPPNTFSSDATMTVSVTGVAASDRAALKKTDIGVEITISSGEQPAKNMTVKVNYRDADIAGLDESKLSLCRYDAVNSRWITLPTTVYADNNYLIATIDHLSKFGVMQLAAALTLSDVKVFPNPYNTSGNLTFDNLTSEADIKIYTVAGTLVRELAEADGNGRCEWDGKNESGEIVASGIYLAYISSSVGDKIVKIAVVK